MLSAWFVLLISCRISCQQV